MRIIGLFFIWEILNMPEERGKNVNINFYSNL